MRKLFTIFAVTTATTLALMASSTAHAAGPVYNDEGALVDDSGPMRELTFEEGDTLEGEVLSMDNPFIVGSSDRRFQSLITIKWNFVPELIELSWDAPM